MIPNMYIRLSATFVKLVNSLQSSQNGCIKLTSLAEDGALRGRPLSAQLLRKLPCANTSGDFAVVGVWHFLCLVWQTPLQSAEESGPVQQGATAEPGND